MIRQSSLSASDREALFEVVEREWGAVPAPTPTTEFDSVYSLGPDHLMFTGFFPEPPGPPVERALVLARWPRGLLGDRGNLVPPLGFYHDHDALLYRCALAYHLNAPLALHGHTGVGKTELVRYFAALMGAPLYRMNLHGLSTTDDIIGKLLPAGSGQVVFQDGLVTAAVRRGGILLLEEMNATGQEVWFALHGLLDGSRALVLVEKDNEVVHQHSYCRLFATFNPAEYPGLYPGTKELSAAYLRRWTSVRMGFVSPEIERAILQARFPAYAQPPLEALLDTMLEVARISREILQRRVHAFNFVLSTGTLESWAALAVHVGPLAAARMCFYDLLDDRMKALFREQIFAYVTDWDLSLLEEHSERVGV
ncbi:MAG: AAA family ATPase [Thermoleophilia bacterium]|nr:AAA family ATPase [Thermoleophilia bacterium]